ncbi:hypothetical protein DFJ58DRAFT_734939 [Suillus subalutaceus]|uniref:uncharacterized protein n=1 Tax=Suillus subalutaceus TaxID=48586 RepID=UPI001B86281D|nr:uncharacterized protein DFJ58DRAFT_734939 [Suillus subalutaceus]KAG1836515.1 hypothetical protein DFJ58DRAFT_734939 [Suillus subalutaceus]
MNNPSNISLDAADIALPAYYQDVIIGRAAFNLVTGEDTIPGEFYYEPANLNDIVAEVGVVDFILTWLLISAVQPFPTSFLQTGNSLPLTIQGDSASTPICITPAGA